MRRAPATSRPLPLLLTLLLSGCGSISSQEGRAVAPDPDRTNSDRPEAAADPDGEIATRSAERALRALMDAWDSGDTSGFPSLFTDSAVYDDMPNDRRLTGVDQIAGYVEHVHGWGDSVSMVTRTVTAAPGFAVAEWTFRAIQTAPMGGMVRIPTCRWIELSGLTAVSTRNGRIERAVDYIQVMPLLLQVGGRIELPGGTVLGADSVRASPPPGCEPGS